MTRTEELIALDRRLLWHPFTAPDAWESEPQIVIERAEGMYLVDTDGRRYVDGVSSLWCNVFGHRVPEIDAAIRDQLDRAAHTTLLGLASVPSIELARRIAGIVPAPLSRVFYSDDGSTAIEAAIKIAYQYCMQNGRERRTRFVAFGGAYHGDTIGSVSVGGIGLFHGAYRPLLFEVHRAPYPYCYRCPLGIRTPPEGDEGPATCGLACLREFERILDRHGSEICACVIEPRVQGASGMIVAPDGFLRGVAKACRDHGVLLIADEVATGLGRTGAMFACDLEEVTPDFLCIAKGLSGGYLPLAATVTTDEIYDGFRGPPHLGRTFHHGHTYTGNALGAAAAAATIDLIRSRRLVDHVRSLDAEFAGLLEPIAAIRAVGEIRRQGMMVGIELVADRATKRPFDAERRVGHRVAAAARGEGVMVRPLGDVIVLNPPPAIDAAVLRDLCRGVERAIRKVGSGEAT